jgi:hypothetical protein
MGGGLDHENESCDREKGGEGWAAVAVTVVYPGAEEGVYDESRSNRWHWWRCR